MHCIHAHPLCVQAVRFSSPFLHTEPMPRWSAIAPLAIYYLQFKSYFLRGWFRSIFRAVCMHTLLMSYPREKLQVLCLGGVQKTQLYASPMPESSLLWLRNESKEQMNLEMVVEGEKQQRKKPWGMCKPAFRIVLTSRLSALGLFRPSDWCPSINHIWLLNISFVGNIRRATFLLWETP